MKEKTNKTKWLHTRLTEEEYAKIKAAFRQTTCRNLSEYSRDKLLEKPITVFYRNQSMDDFMAEFMKLRKDLNAIGNNLNQSVKKLHTISHIPELTAWVRAQEKDHESIVRITEKINEEIRKFSEVWLQSSRQDLR